MGFKIIYTDGTHLIADTEDELHEFADKIGLKRSWFQSSSWYPHYDLMGSKKRLVVVKGAIKLSPMSLERKCNELRKKGKI